MTILKILCCSVFLAFMVLNTSASAKTLSEFDLNSKSELELARRYLMASCVIHRYPNTPLAVEANGWAGGIIEFGQLSLEQYAEISKIVKNNSDLQLSNQDGSIMNLAACYELSRSEKIGQILRDIINNRTNGH